MFRHLSKSSKPAKGHPDFSGQLKTDLRLWNVPPTYATAYITTLSGASTLCVDSEAQLVVVGTARGEIRIYDRKFRECILQVPGSSASAGVASTSSSSSKSVSGSGLGAGIVLLSIARPKEGFKLLCVDSRHRLHVWNLDVYGKPVLQATESFGQPIYRIATNPSHSHAILSTQRGDVLVYNLEEFKRSPYEIPCCLENPLGSNSNAAVDIAIHPKELNHVLIAYSHGIVLYDLMARKSIKTFLRTSPTTGNQILTSVTTLSIHPSSHHFAAGYEDGAICIWDIPAAKCIWTNTLATTDSEDTPPPEPIFKFEWIGENETSWLAIIGGLNPANQNHSEGVTVLAFDKEFLQGSAEQISNKKPHHFLYPTPKPVHDFTILPKDPNIREMHSTIYIIFGNPSDPSGSYVDAFQYPPSLPELSLAKEGIPIPVEDKAVIEEFSAEFEESAEVSKTLASALDDLNSLSDAGNEEVVHLEPNPDPLPLPLHGGKNALVSVQLIQLDWDAYSRLTGYPTSDDGTDSYRILLTQHQGTTIRFFDVSIKSGQNLAASPYPLIRLTISPLSLPEIALRPDIDTIQIRRTVFGDASLECAIEISTGEILIFGIGTASRTEDDLPEEIIDVRDIRNSGDGSFTSRFIIKAQKSKPAIISVSDIGFLALTYEHDLFIVLDLRGPRILLRETPPPSVSLTPTGGGRNHIEYCYWAICGTANDLKLAPRLITQRPDGHITIYTLGVLGGQWMIDESQTTKHTLPVNLNAPILFTTLDAKTGEDCRTKPSRLALVMGAGTEEEQIGLDTYWIIANSKEIRSILGLTGDKVSKVSFGPSEVPGDIAMMFGFGASVLVTIKHDQIVIYSLPTLEPIHTFKLPNVTFSRSFISCSCAGDIIQSGIDSAREFSISITPLLARSATSHGAVNFRVHKYTKLTESQQPESTSWGNTFASWQKTLIFGTQVTGDEIDILFSPPENPAPSGPLSAINISKKEGKPDASTQANTWSSWTQQLTSAAAERGERLNQLQEQFQHLEAGSKDWASQAKRMAEKQAAKRWFQL
ncbi:hypothetical protein M422DRAFT_28963 [Sphaerobolus stellatus SS14]|nr:hypothetical protein M422DRAFT_28963 [Sphaerobolus stellatus SS14]